MDCGTRSYTLEDTSGGDVSHILTRTGLTIELHSYSMGEATSGLFAVNLIMTLDNESEVPYSKTFNINIKDCT